MEILKPKRSQLSKTLILDDDGEKYARIEYSDGCIEWQPISYDGEYENGNSDLEIRYQKLLKNHGKK